MSKIQWPPKVKNGGGWQMASLKQAGSKRQKIRRRRELLFESQKGVCYWHDRGCLYVDRPMTIEPSHYSSPYYGTFEHLHRKRDGGTHREGNLVLAHRGCNEAREHPRHAQRFPKSLYEWRDPDGRPVQPNALSAALDAAFAKAFPEREADAGGVSGRQSVEAEAVGNAGHLPEDLGAEGWEA